ncbi:MAG: cell division protein SepF [Gammaproteobacteria bacterium]|nr:cell division protein SepF [Gammaproteobacteria bacterium]
MSKEKSNIENKIKFINVEDAERTTDYADLLMQGIALCLDFRECPEDEANQILFFLEGVNYATDGYPILMKEKIFLLATKQALKDPDIKAFIKEYKEVNQ